MDEEQVDKWRAECQELIQERLQTLPPPIACEGSSIPNGSYVSGWVVVAEFMDPDGLKWLASIGHEGSTSWGRDGMLLHATDIGMNGVH